MTRRYKAFISYSWADRAWGEWLHRTLETYRAPKGVADGQSLHPIFKDREEEAAGGSVGAAIEAALEASENLIVICSPRSAKSQWVNREVAWFKTHKDKARVFALIVDGEPGHASEDCFPKALTRKIGPDLQPTEEWEDAPLAADARPEGDGKRGAKLKLAAALLGVGLDALVRRDERRRTVRRRFVTSAAFGLAAVLGALSIFAFNQRDAAVVARNEAVKARDDAEGLIELILTDLKSDLEGFGTLKSVTQIGNRAIGYYEGQDVKALTPDQLGRRARVLLMLGEADNKRGDLTAALARYETAAATTSEQLARDPGNPQRMFDHAQSVFWVGYIAWQRGDRIAAKTQFTEYHDLAQRLVATDPANEDWQAELDYAYSNLGTLAMDDGEAEEAEGYFRKSLKIAQVRLAKAPDDADRVLAAGQVYAWLADALHLNNQLHAARNAREAELLLYDGVFKADFHGNLARAKTSALLRTAQLEIALGQLTAALKAATSAVTLSKALFAADAENADLAEQYVRSLAVFGETAVFANRGAEALEPLLTAISIAERFLALDGDVFRWKGINLAHSKLVLGRILELEGSTKKAQDVFESVAFELKDEPMVKQPGSIIQRRYCQALAGRARLTNSSSESEKIVQLLGLEPTKLSPESLGLLAEAHQKIGEMNAAALISVELFGAGFRHPEFMALLDEFPDLKAAAERRAR